MTSEKTSIYSALCSQLRRVKFEYMRRHGRYPNMVFSIGRRTHYDLLNETELMFVHFEPTGQLGKDDIQFDGFKGRVVDGLSGFVIQVLN